MKILWIIHELILTLSDCWRCADVGGHLSAWWDEVSGNGDIIIATDSQYSQSDRPCRRCGRTMINTVFGLSFICMPCDLVEVDGYIVADQTVANYLASHR